MKLSVIVPVYNVEKYIAACLDSLLAQPSEEIEFIIIDDGSQDQSIAIAKQYVQRDSRFKIFHKRNGGLSDARNFGVSRCTGEYVFFLDSDDTIEDDMIAEVITTLDREKPDLLVFDMLFVWENSDQRKVVPGIKMAVAHPTRAF